MRRRSSSPVHRRPIKVWCAGFLCCTALGCGLFSYYVNAEIKPTLHELAEYQARSTTVETLNRAVNETMQHAPEWATHVYTMENGMVALNAVAVTAAQTDLVAAAERAMEQLPEHSETIPFGSLTNNSLLGGLGPGWCMTIRPQGYVQSRLCQTARSLAINSVQYSAELVLTVTVNMILDGRSSTITVEHKVLLASVIITGQTPNYYAAD